MNREELYQISYCLLPCKQTKVQLHPPLVVAGPDDDVENSQVPTAGSHCCGHGEGSNLQDQLTLLETTTLLFQMCRGESMDEGVMEQVSFYGSQWAERLEGRMEPGGLQRHAHGDPRLPARLHLLMFSLPSQAVSPAGDLGCHTCVFGDIWY